MSIDKHSRAFAAPKLQDGKQPLIGMSLPEMEVALTDHGMPKYRAKQIYNWVYQRGATDFSGMSSISKADRHLLDEHFTIARPKVILDQKSKDGTHKWLLQMHDGQQVECVFIPEKDRGALCVSSQVGCTLTCKFCHTGTQPLVRNLGPHEILAQVMHVRDVLGEWPSSSPEKRLFTNIVFMGMGEPLYNYPNVAKACQIITDGDGLAISRRRITLSTSGVIPEIRKCGEELGVNLAISLHATNNELRSQIMPINNKYPLEELMAACKDYPGASYSRQITFEYVMLKGVNDSDEDAHALVKLLEGVHAKVNLIPFNTWPGSGYECSSWARIESFGSILERAGYESPIRRPRGRDILAACGQLKSESKRIKKTQSVHKSGEDETPTNLDKTEQIVSAS